MFGLDDTVFICSDLQLNSKNINIIIIFFILLIPILNNVV